MQIKIDFALIRRGNAKLRMARRELDRTMKVRKAVFEDTKKPRSLAIPLFILISCCIFFFILIMMRWGESPRLSHSEISPPLPPAITYNNYYPMEVLQYNITQVKEKVVIGDKQNCLIVKDTSNNKEYWKCET